MNIRDKLGRFINGHPPLFIERKGTYVPCANCKKMIYRTPCKLKKFKSAVCSSNCKSAISKKRFHMENHPMWKGGKRISKSGYVMILMRSHPFNCYGYVREHRLVMEKKIGRYLQTNELVHHINGILTDNRLKNLKIVTREKHNTIHHTGKIGWRRLPKWNKATTSGK